MELQDVMQVLSVGTSTGLVVWGLYMVTVKLWPWWVQRDTEERQRKYEQSVSASNAQSDLATALYENAASRAVFARSMENVIGYLSTGKVVDGD